MPTNSQLSKSDRREAARLKAEELKREQLKKEARVRRITLLSIIVGILVIAALVVVIVVQGKEKATVDPNAAGPTTATGANEGIPFGSDGVAGTVNDGAVTVEIIQDYLCPWCGRFEAANQGTLDELRQAGDITVVIHPVSILAAKQTSYSVRSAGAFAYIAQEAPDKALAFNAALYTNQPEEGVGDGLSDDEIVDIAKQAGVPDDVAEASVKDTFHDWVINRAAHVATIENVVGDTGSLSTPTILINGERYSGDPTDADAFRTALDEAINAG